MSDSIEKAGVETNWPDGWYVLEDGRVNGPLEAKKVFNLPRITTIGNARLISRKGFSQWYPIGDLATVFSMTQNLGEQTGSEIDRLKTTVAEGVKNLEQLQTKSSSPKVAAKKIEAKTKSEIQAQKAKTPLPEVNKSTSAISKKAALLQEYFLLRGRLRLGKLKSPWASGFFALPVTLCIYWCFWFAKISREVNWHAFNKNRRSLSVILASIPGVHTIMIYRLAKQIRLMEEQNGYANTSPALASFLSLIPPFSLVYLQDSVNSHWWLHVNHARPKKS